MADWEKEDKTKAAEPKVADKIAEPKVADKIAEPKWVDSAKQLVLLETGDETVKAGVYEVKIKKRPSVGWAIPLNKNECSKEVKNFCKRFPDNAELRAVFCSEIEQESCWIYNCRIKMEGEKLTREELEKRPILQVVISKKNEFARRAMNPVNEDEKELPASWWSTMMKHDPEGVFGEYFVKHDTLIQLPFVHDIKKITRMAHKMASIFDVVYEEFAKQNVHFELAEYEHTLAMTEYVVDELMDRLKNGGHFFPELLKLLISIKSALYGLHEMIKLQHEWNEKLTDFDFAFSQFMNKYHFDVSSSPNM